MIDTRKAINFANLRPEELEPRLELQILSFGGGGADGGTGTAPGFAGDGTTAGGPG